MEYRPLDITVISATSLKNVNLFMKMGVYVVVSLISGDSVSKQKTNVSHGGSNPRWSHRIKYTVDESAIPTSTLLFVLRSRRMLGDRDIGEVSIPIRDLLENASGAENDEHVVDYQVRSIKGKSRGTLTFSHQFKEKHSEPGAKNKGNVEDSHVNGRTSASCPPTSMVYVMPQQGMPAYGQGPYSSPQGYPGGYQSSQYGGTWYTTQGPYPYPPQQMGYGYTQQSQGPPHKPKDKKKGGGHGKLGLGLGAGLIGGLLMGDMVSDAADMADEMDMA